MFQEPLFLHNGFVRWSLGFHNPNHAAAALCALLPLCWGWRRHAWLGYSLAAALFAMLLLTQSRTGILVAGLEAAVWWWFVGRRAGCTARAPRRRRWPWAVAGLAVVGLSLWWLGPRLALDGGADGLDFYRVICEKWRDALCENGMLFFEVGIGQADQVLRIMRSHGFGDIQIVKDLNNIPRVVYGTRVETI